MAQIETWLNQDMMEAVKVRYLDGNLFSMDNAGNLIGVNLTKAGAAYSGGGSVSANVIRADGGTVAVTGALSGDKATVVLPQAAYAVPGVVSVVIKLTVSGEITTIAAVVANVYRSSTDTAVDPGTIIPSVQTLINSINNAVASIPADYSSLWTSLAPAFSTSTAYTVGQYVTYNGGLYRFTSAHSAGAWNSAHVVAVNLGGEVSSLKNAIDYKADKVFGGDTTSVYYTAVGGKMWKSETGTVVDISTRAASDQIVYTPDMKSISVPSGYKLTVYGNDEGINHPITRVSSIFVSTFNFNDYEYKYIYVVIRTDPESTISSDLTNVLSIKKYNSSYDFALEKDLNETNTSVATLISNMQNMSSAIQNLSSEVSNKADKVFGGTVSDNSLPLESGKKWDQESGIMSDAPTRASSNQIIIAPNMTSLLVASGYKMYIYGNNSGSGNALNTVRNWNTSSFSIENYNGYKYLFVMIARTDDGDITSDNLNNVLVLSTYDDVMELATSNDVETEHEEIQHIETLNDEVIKENIHASFTNDDKLFVNGLRESFVFRVIQGVRYVFSCDTSFDRRIVAYNETEKPTVDGIQMVGKTVLTSNEFTALYTGWAVLFVNMSINTEIEETFSIKSKAPLFMLKPDSKVNVTLYGAKGDGSNCTSAIAAAIADCPENGTVYFPKGLYVVTNIALKSNMSILGDGQGSIIQLDSGVAEGNNCCTVNNVHDITIQNIAFNGNRSNNASLGDAHDTGYNGIHIRGSYNIVVDNVWSYNNGYHGCIMTNSHNIIIRDSKFYNNGYRPIHGHDNVKGVKVESNECWNNGLGFTEAGVQGLFPYG